MDFFDHQDVARKKTGRLVLLMLAAVVSIIALVYGVVLAAAFYIVDQGAASGTSSFGAASTPEVPYLTLLGVTSVGVLLIVGCGSLVKMGQLSSGGKAVAESMGGRPIDPDTADADERRLLNVVHEMAIASGAPVPTVYMMDHEDAINAFAAGWSLDDAVIGVTRGCVQQLSRDELQGVIAHEFSHILNGDMRINLRLVGVIFGILVISVIGGVIMRSIFYSGGTRRSNNKNNGGAVIAILLLGLALYIIGYVGVFFGRLIQAAISRQREFLADASAVQFTRNPDGISGALQRIGGFASGSKMHNAHAIEHSHMFFGSAVTSLFGGVFATHPPLHQRIKRIDPSWQGEFSEARPVTPYGSLDDGAAGFAGSSTTHSTPAEPLSQPSAALGFAPGAVAASAVEQIGELTPAHLQHAYHLIETLPSTLRTAAQTTTGAQALVLAMLLDRKDADVRAKQLTYLDGQSLGPVAALTHRLAEAADRLRVEQRLPLLDLSLPALSRLAPQALEDWHEHLDALIAADDRLDLFEWALRQVVWRHLVAPERGGGGKGRPLTGGRDLRGALSVLLSVLSRIGASNAREASRAFEAAAQRVPKLGVELLPSKSVSMGRLTEAVDLLGELAPKAQRSVIEACAAAIAADRQVTARESELMRAVAETLGVPMPPLLPGQRLI